MAKRKRRQYTDEFKAEAVKLIVEEGYSISQAARNLDINTNMLTRWKNELAGSALQRKEAADVDNQGASPRRSSRTSRIKQKITCEKLNEATLRTIEKNGAEFLHSLRR